MRLVVSSALVLLYSLFVLANLYTVVMGGFSVTRGIFLVLSVLAIIALTGEGRGSSRFWAYVLCGVLGFAGILSVGYSIWAYARHVSIESIIMWAGPILVLVAATTYWVIRTRKVETPDSAAELESRWPLVARLYEQAGCP